MVEDAIKLNRLTSDNEGFIGRVERQTSLRLEQLIELLELLP